MSNFVLKIGEIPIFKKNLTTTLEKDHKNREASLKRLKSLESNEIQLKQKITNVEKQASDVKIKMKNLLLSIKKIANDSIHRKSKVF